MNRHHHHQSLILSIWGARSVVSKAPHLKIKKNKKINTAKTAEPTWKMNN